VALVVGLGAGWLLFSPDTIDNEVGKLVRDSTAAWDAGDGDAAVALMTANGKHYDWTRPSGMSGEQIADSITQDAEPSSFTVIGDTMISTDGPTREVAYPMRIGDDEDYWDCVALATVVDTEDGPRIAVSTGEESGYTVEEVNR
jgi:hypothetical protein